MAYVEATGTTHLLSAEAGLLAALLRDAPQPLDIADLSSAYATFSQSAKPHAHDAETEHEFSLHDMLRELERIGLATIQGS